MNKWNKDKVAILSGNVCRFLWKTKWVDLQKDQRVFLLINIKETATKKSGSKINLKNPDRQPLM